MCDPAYGEDCSYCSNSCETVVVPASYCGDGVTDLPDEDCDTAENNGIECEALYGETCAYCASDCSELVIDGGYCGDGITDPAYEQCDDGNTDTGDGCETDCRVTEICDGIDNNLDGSIDE
ncbi:MAG: hypothetical protein H6765_10470 [Candidatus Peribacteria bacterium]|nr:MAG: hypothetical protein H6765_10470 [Candidatus Peribacteria bacterium]